MTTAPPLWSSLPAELALLTVLDRPELLQALDGPLDWVRTIELAERHRLTGMLASALEGGDGYGAPPNLRRALLAERDQRAQRAATAVLPQLEEVCAALVRAEVVPTLLKGAALVWSGRIPPGERPMADLDLLVAEDELDRVTRVLEDLGYHMSAAPALRAWARSEHYQDPAWHHRDRPLSIEIHWGLLEPHHRLAFDRRTLRTAELRLPDGTMVRRLDDRDQLAHLCLHFWRDRAEGLPASLGQLWDIRRGSPHPDSPLWTQLREAAVERGHTQVVATVLACSHLILGAPLPPRFPEVAELATTQTARSFAIRRVLAPRPLPVQLLMVTPDVDYRWWRIIRRVLVQARKPVRDLRASYGDAGGRRLRLHHARRLARMLYQLARAPVETRAEMRLDRWAHQLR